MRLGVLGWALATAGRKDEARQILEELRARPSASPTAVSAAWLLDPRFGALLERPGLSPALEGRAP